MSLRVLAEEENTMKDEKIQAVRDAFATTLRQKRNEAGLSQEELGFRAGIAMRYVSLLETGKRQPTISTIASICDALDMPMSEFMQEVEGRI